MIKLSESVSAIEDWFAYMLAMVFLRHADVVWLEASGPSIVLDDVTILELQQSIEVLETTKPAGRK